MITLESIGRLVKEKRGERGIRAVAEEVGVSASTLSRVERGHLPDLENYRKICTWLGIDPAAVVGTPFIDEKKEIARVHFKKDNTLTQETATALVQLILAAQRAYELQDRE